MSDYLLTGAVTNALNSPSVTADEAPKLKPFVALPRSWAPSPARWSTSA